MVEKNPPKRSKVEEATYIYFGSGIEVIQSEYPIPYDKEFVTWDTEMSSGVSFESLNSTMKLRIVADIESLFAKDMLTDKGKCYFIKQKGHKNLWLFQHGFRGNKFSDVSLSDIVSVMAIECEDFDVNECKQGSTHHFQLLPCLESNPCVREQYIKLIGITSDSDVIEQLKKSLNQLDDVINGAIFQKDAKKFAFKYRPEEISIYDEKIRRERLLFSLNEFPLYQNCVIDAVSSFNTDSLSFYRNMSGLDVKDKHSYPFIFRGVPDLLFRKEGAIVSCLDDKGVLIELKHPTTVSTLCKSIAMPDKCGELAAQLYMIACTRVIREYLRSGECNLQLATASGIYFNQCNLFKLKITIDALSCSQNPFKCTITPYSTKSASVLCHVLTDSF